MTELQNKYLTKEQFLKKYPFITKNMLKNFLQNDIDGFRTKVKHKIGGRVLLNEENFLRMLAESKDVSKQKNEDHLDEFITNLSKTLPDLVSDKDLISTGIFSSACLCRYRKMNQSPPFIQYGRRYRYLKKDILDWIKTLYNNGNKK